ncbi:MAG: hypothetical protein WC804_04305 [Sphingomonas sp.]|jgi:hypothetical protein|uniref:hypothetical protein n=1 Tax=Sphingomonas sp. TaxID=28214 RepID=UPI00356B1029
MMTIVLVSAPVTAILAEFIDMAYRKAGDWHAAPKVLIQVVFAFHFAIGDRCRAVVTPKKKGDSLRSRPFPCRDNLTPGGV